MNPSRYALLDDDEPEAIAPAPVAPRAVDKRTPYRYHPQGSTEVTCQGVAAVVYTYTGAHGPCAIAYRGNSAKKVWNYRFHSEGERAARISQFFEETKQAAENRAAHRAVRKNTQAAFRHGYRVGDIVYASWGYDQTNIDYYQIVSTTEKTVTFREVGQERSRSHHDGGECTPSRDHFVSPAYTRPVRAGWSNDLNDKGSIPFAEHPGGYQKSLSFWDGRPKGWSGGH